LEIQQKIVELKKFYQTISLQNLNSRDLKPSRPRLAKVGLETSLEAETKSRDSITGDYPRWIRNRRNYRH